MVHVQSQFRSHVSVHRIWQLSPPAPSSLVWQHRLYTSDNAKSKLRHLGALHSSFFKSRFLKSQNFCASSRVLKSNSSCQSVPLPTPVVSNIYCVSSFPLLSIYFMFVCCVLTCPTTPSVAMNHFVR